MISLEYPPPITTRSARGHTIGNLDEQRTTTPLAHGCHKKQRKSSSTELVVSPLNPCPSARASAKTSAGDMLPQISPFHQVPHPAIPSQNCDNVVCKANKVEAYIKILPPLVRGRSLLKSRQGSSGARTAVFDRWSDRHYPTKAPAGGSDMPVQSVAQDQPGPVGQICPTSWLSLQSDSVRPTTGRTRLFEQPCSTG
ncbi:hypothetical protein PCANC_24841 [Puccinia coronata f. sp. avenae]|uniref:Uncharacterized protein n=1 Tax=Puccinia coronata f. sp. avenae TaxID=200324 RepID=A0A2N5U1T0_9BASI|nr:hypothetical protein PCANC_24841 [Puccinia coronata f. sp. avenae]